MRITSLAFAVVVTGSVLSVGFGVGSASAAPLDVALYLSPGGCNNCAPLGLDHGTFTFSLIVDPTHAQGGITFGVGDMTIQATGTLTMSAFTPASGTTSNLVNPNELLISATGDPVAGNTAPYVAGTLSIFNSGDIASGGTIGVFSGDYISGGGVKVSLQGPQGLADANFIPEPGTLLLLGAGLGGLAAAAGARRSH
ncbi:MAG TPA: PEP-CTERM sorting domain-containing protein [Myxococcota bacterium]|nr:PEP-CTERM sorting domain-containing protein [Myxococcota bacterium]